VFLFVKIFCCYVYFVSKETRKHAVLRACEYCFGDNYPTVPLVTDNIFIYSAVHIAALQTGDWCLHNLSFYLQEIIYKMSKNQAKSSTILNFASNTFSPHRVAICQ